MLLAKTVVFATTLRMATRSISASALGQTLEWGRGRVMEYTTMTHLVGLLNSLYYPADLLNKYAGLTLGTLAGWFLLSFLLLTLGDRSGLRTRLGRFAWWSGVGAAMACVAALLLSTLAYARAPGVMDHAEVSVLSISSLWGHGKPLYCDLDAAERYSLGYGPAVYIFDSAVLSACGSRIRVVKTVGAALLVFSLMAMGICARRLGCSRTSAILVLGYIAVGIALLELASVALPIASWVRPDPHLLFWTSFSALCTTIRRPLLAVVGIGVAIGICVNLKVHGPVYVLPMLLPLFRQTGVRGLAGCFATATAVALAPFALPGVSLPNYVELLQGVVGYHPFVADLLIAAVTASGFLLLPIVVLLAMNLRCPGNGIQNVPSATGPAGPLPSARHAGHPRAGLEDRQYALSLAAPAAGLRDGFQFVAAMAAKQAP